MIIEKAFPLGKTGGLIEASFMSSSKENISCFRWVKTGGLIEAGRGNRLWSLLCCCFRWVKPAASLKRAPAARPPAREAPVSAG